MNVFELVGTMAIKGADQAKSEIKGVAGEGEAAQSRLSKAFAKMASSGNPVASGVGRIGTAVSAMAGKASSAKGKVSSAFSGMASSANPVVSGVGRAVSALGSLNKASQSVAKGATAMGNAFSVALGNVITQGVGAVAGSLGSAISRVDTLNSFSTVMGNLGYDADVAQASIGLISDRLQGLPTATDSMVSMVQQLAASTGDLDQATKLGLAFNDMTVAAGADADGAARAFEQYSKSLGKGKFELESWQTLQEVMPGQLKQVSEYMLGAGSSTMDLYDALKDGKVSVDDFNDALLTLDTEGAEGITSFSQAALTGSAGIQTSFSNMKTAITRGLANIIEGIGSDNIIAAITAVKGGINGFFSAFQPIAASVGEAIRSFREGTGSLADVVGTALDGIAGLVSEQLPGIVDGVLSFVTDNGPALLQVAIDFFCQIVNAVAAALPDIIAAIPQIIAGIVGTLWDNRGQILDAGAKVVGALAEGIGSVIGQVADAAGQVASAIGDEIASIPGKALQWGADIIGNLVAGIRGKIDSIVSAASDVASAIADFLHFSEPDKGPLSDFHTSMPDMMAMMAEGIRDNLPLVEREAQRVAAALDVASSSRLGAQGVKSAAAQSVAGPSASAGASPASSRQGGSSDVIAWLSANLPAIIAECTPTVGERDFARMARKAVAYA